MNNQLNNALKPVASFRIVNPAGNPERKLCLIPGHFNLTGVVDVDDGHGGTMPVITYNDKKPIVDAGYSCDEVADDYNQSLSRSAVQVHPNNEMTRYRDFLNFIRLKQLRVSKIRLTNRTASSVGRAQFNKRFEVSASSIGSRAGSDFINIANYKNPANYDQDIIEIDLAQQNLLLDATTLTFLTVAADADFDIEFTLDDTPLVRV
jgi:hypothetical protein